MIMIENEQQFEQEVTGAATAVMVDFYTDWCGPCKALSGLLEELDAGKKEYEIAKVNVEELPGLAQKYRVASVPTILVFKNGEVSARQVGLVTRNELEQMI